MNMIPKVGPTSMALARVVRRYAVDGVFVTDDEALVEEVSSMLGKQWLVPGQAVRDSLAALESLGAVAFDRRPRGPMTDTSKARRVVMCEHWLWSLLNIVDTVEVA